MTMMPTIHAGDNKETNTNTRQSPVLKRVDKIDQAKSMKPGKHSLL